MNEDAAAPPLHVISVGRIEAGALESLTRRFALSVTEIEQQAAEPFRWNELARPINRAIDDAPGWILLLRPGETVPRALSSEIARVAVDQPVAWAFRIETVLTYCGRPLYRRRRRQTGEIRVFHGRKCRFQPAPSGMELRARGTVIRLSASLERSLHDSVEGHLQDLRNSGAPHTSLRRALVFLSRLWRDRGKVTGRSIRFYWREAGWDRGGISDGSSDADSQARETASLR